MDTIYIPLLREDTNVAIPVDQLPSMDPRDVMRLLIDEMVPLEIWLRVAVRPLIPLF